jgi:hypothetical protein
MDGPQTGSYGKDGIEPGIYNHFKQKKKIGYILSIIPP